MQILTFTLTSVCDVTEAKNEKRDNIPNFQPIPPATYVRLYSSFLRDLAIRADRLPPGVMIVPMGVPLLAVPSLFGGVPGVSLDAPGVLVPYASFLPAALGSGFADILANSKTKQNPNKPTYGRTKSHTISNVGMREPVCRRRRGGRKKKSIKT